MISGTGLSRLADHTQIKREETASFWVAKKKNAPLTAQEQSLLEGWLANDVRNQGALIRAEVIWQATARAVALRTDKLEPANVSETEKGSVSTLSRRHTLSAVAASISLLLLPRASREMTRFYSTRDNTLDKTLPLIGHLSLDCYSQIRTYGNTLDHLAGRCLLSCPSKTNARVSHIHASLRGKLQSSLNPQQNRLLLLDGEANIKNLINNQIIILQPGEELDISATGKMTRRLLSPEDLMRETNWLQGVLELHGQSLAEAAAIFNRYNQKKIFTHGAAHSLVLIGSFSLRDPDTFVDAARSALHVDSVITPGRIDLY